MTGLNGALDTLVSQAFGYGQIRLCGTIFNRGCIILTLVFIPIAILLSFSEPLLVKLGQDPLVSEYTQSFIVILLPSIYLRCIFDLIRKFLNCMRASWVPMTAMLASMILHPLFCYYFVVVKDYDIAGIGIASNLTMLILVLVIICIALTVK